jgi:MSHA biogenesis protein MshM
MIDQNVRRRRCGAGGPDFNCGARLIEEVRRVNHVGKMLAPMTGDAHPMSIDSLRRLRLLFEDFPKNHNLILIAQPGLLTKLPLFINDDIKSRVAYSVLVPEFAPDDMSAFILAELDRVALAHSSFSEDALSLIVRSSEGVIRAAKHLCVASLLEAVKDREKTIGLKQVNRVLMQPHWRHEHVVN